MKSHHGTLRNWLCAFGWISFILCFGSRMLTYTAIPLSSINPNISVQPSNHSTQIGSTPIINKQWDPNISFCDWNKMVFGAHHKTGTFIMFHLRDRMKDLYANRCSADDRVPDQSLIPHQTGKLSMQRIRCFIAENMAEDADHENIYILNVVRHPVDTVLSGYNYHLNTMNWKEWVNGKYTLDKLDGWFREQYPPKIFDF